MCDENPRISNPDSTLLKCACTSNSGLGGGQGTTKENALNDYMHVGCRVVVVFIQLNTSYYGSTSILQVLKYFYSTDRKPPSVNRIPSNRHSPNGRCVCAVASGNSSILRVSSLKRAYRSAARGAGRG